MVKEAQEELAHKAITWCEMRDKVTSPNNIVCALDNLDLLKEPPVDKIDYLINHITEQRNNQQYLNALVTVIELHTLLLREFSNLLKRKS